MTREERRARTAARKAAGANLTYPKHHKAKAVAPAKADRAQPCAHLGAPTGATVQCPSCAGTVSLKVLGCAIHGTCTPTKKAAGHACCKSCPDYSPPAPARSLPVIAAEPAPPKPIARPPVRHPPVGRRHLVYHVLPVAGNGVWQRGVDALRLRWSLFTGRKIVAVATGGPITEQIDGQEGPGPKARTLPLDTVAAVRAYLPPDAEVIEVENDPARWESASWPLLWERVLDGADDLDAVLYAHAKGVTRRPGSPCHRWADLLYALSLDHWRETEDALRRYPVVGSLLKRGRFFGAPSNASEWHYSGNFWWARAGDARTKIAAVPVPADKWGAEAWAGIAFPVEDAGEVFGPKVPDFHLYKPEHLDRVLTDHAAWAASHVPAPAAVMVPAAPRDPAGVRLSVIVPSSGRASIDRTLASIAPQLLPGDELIVRPDRSGDWGATPRTEGARQATGDYLMWMDDDDIYLPGAFATVRNALRENPGRPHLFRLRRDGEFHDELPRVNQVRVGEVSTHMIVAPNDPARLGQWGTRYEGDFDFIASTLALYSAGSVVFRPEVIAVWRPDPDGVWSKTPWPKWWSHESGSWDEAAFIETVSRDDYRAKRIALVGSTVLDVGAHVGSFAYAAKARGASVVHCYEPEPVSLTHLRRNSQNMRGVVAFGQAVGALVADMKQAGRPLPAVAPTIDLDTAVIRACQDSPRRRVSLLKIDAEGAEWPALLHFTRWDVVDAIVGEWHEVEWSGAKWGPRDLRTLFARQGWGVELQPEPQLEGGRGLFFAARG